MTPEEEYFIVATVEGQTRAMNRSGATVQLDYRRTMSIFKVAARCYAQGWPMLATLEYALDEYEPFHCDDERHGYKVALGIEFNRRKQAGIRIVQELERTRPFAPREQEM